MEAVVLAAGLSTRFRRGGVWGLKYTVRVAGVPLMSIPVAALRAVGVTRFVIVIAAQTARFMYGDVGKLRELGVEVEILLNREPERGNGHSFMLARGLVTEKRFLVTMSDHIYPPELPGRVLRLASGRNAVLAVGGDRRPGYVDADEATKILADDEGRVVAIGKGLSRYSHIDTGVFAVRADAYDVLKGLRYGRLGFSDVVAHLAERTSEAVVADVTGVPWTDVDTYGDYEQLVSGSRRPVLDAVRDLLELLSGLYSRDRGRA